MVMWALVGLGLPSCSENEAPKENRGGEKEAAWEKDVEVAPGKWVRVKCEGGDEDREELSIPWQGKEVHWKGAGIAVTLREWEGKLYLIAFDRSQMENVRLRYYRQEGQTFSEIEPKEFPPRIASRNMWLFPWAHSRADNERCICEIESDLNLDPEDVYFEDTLTGKIWCQLMTGKKYEEISGRLGYENRVRIQREFSKKHKPIKLTLLIKEHEEKIAMFVYPKSGRSQCEAFKVILVTEGAHWVKGVRIEDARFDYVVAEFSNKWPRHRWKGIGCTWLADEAMGNYMGFPLGAVFDLTTTAIVGGKEVNYRTKITVGKCEDVVDGELKRKVTFRPPEKLHLGE